MSPSPPCRRCIVAALGTLQILAWGSSFYLPAVLARPIVEETGWSFEAVVGGLSLGLLVSGLLSPRIGRTIGQHGGRIVLALGAVVSAAGLAVLGTAPHFAVYLGGWAILGAGMAAGLYDAAFATLGTIYGREARGPITGVTLFGGFASTVCWPISAFLVAHVGWRVACFAYAAAFLLAAVPLYILVLPRGAPAHAGILSPPPASPFVEPPKERLLFGVVAAILTISAAILSMMGAHLVTLLQARGIDLAGAVTLGMLIGPSAVGARFIEMLAGHRYHPIWTMTASAVLVGLGAGLFAFAGVSVLAAAIVLYAAGNGIGSIAKGTLPLALFGAARYPALMGRLGRPIMIAMALSPSAAALVFSHGGAPWTFAMLLVLAGINLVLVAVLWSLRPACAAAHTDT